MTYLRRQKILGALRQTGGASISELSKALQVTAVTIRKDLAELRREGVVRREHGWAYLTETGAASTDASATKRQIENQEKKVEIAKAAARSVENGDTLIIHGSTTTAEFAQQLVNKRNLTIITNSLSIAQSLSEHHQLKLYVTGGEFHPAINTLAGPQVEQFFVGVYVDKLYMSAVGLSRQSGISHSSTADLAVQKAMLKSARSTYLLLDSTKIGKQSLVSIGGVDLVSTVVTDRGIRPEDCEWLKNEGARVIIAD